MSELINLIDNKRVEFEIKGKKYIYEFSELCLEQVEICREIVELKVQQINYVAEPVTINMLLNSGGYDWRLRLLSYLLLEEKNGELLEYNNKSAEGIYNDIKSMKSKEISKVKEVLDDFFININIQPTMLDKLQNIKSKMQMQMLLSLMSSQNLTNTNILDKKNESKEPTKKTK